LEAGARMGGTVVPRGRLASGPFATNGPDSHYAVVSTKKPTTTERVYHIEAKRLLVGTCQVVTDLTGPTQETHHDRSYAHLVDLGALLHEVEKPAWFLPISGRLYFLKSQLPAGPNGVVEFRTKCELAVELLREQARLIKGKHLAVFDGGYALKSVVRTLVLPEDGSPRVDFLTRLRCDARLFALPLPPDQWPRGQRGPKQCKCGPPLEPPRRASGWKAKWQFGTLGLRTAEDDSLEADGLPTAGPKLGDAGQSDRRLRRGIQRAVHPGDLGGGVDGAADAGTVRRSVPARGRVPRPQATAGLGGVSGVDANPIQRTSQAQWVTMSLLRLLQFRLEACGEVNWWFRPP